MQGKGILGRRICLSEAKAEKTWYLRTSQEVSLAEDGSGKGQDCGECNIGSYRLVFSLSSVQFSSVQLLSHVRLSVTP